MDQLSQLHNTFKLSHFRLRQPFGLQEFRLPESLHSGIWMWWGCQLYPLDLFNPPPPPAVYPGTHFCYRLSRPQDHTVAGRIKSIQNTITPSGIETGEFRLAAQYVSQPRHRITTHHTNSRCRIFFENLITSELIKENPVFLAPKDSLPFRNYKIISSARWYQAPYFHHMFYDLF